MAKIGKIVHETHSRLATNKLRKGSVMGPGDVVQKKADEQYKQVSDLKQQIAQMQIEIKDKQKQLTEVEAAYNNAVKDQQQTQKHATELKVAQKLMYGAGGDPNRTDPPTPVI